jgi:predicted dehydrogenase
MTSPLRMGVLGCAAIAKPFIRDVAPSSAVTIVAVASRTDEKAKDFAAEQGVARHFGSYEAMLADPDIDAIYLPLPNSMHAEWAIKAAEAGKHILCEKPMALNRAEASAMVAAARTHDVMLLEAFPYQFQPQTDAMLALITGGAIGQIRYAQSSFGFTIANPDGNIRMNPELGGGAMLDAGSYALSLVRLAMGSAPARVRATANWAETNVDISMMATLHYPDGRRAQLNCAMDGANHRRALLVGSDGVIETEFLNHTSDTTTGHPFGFQPSQLRVRRGTAFNVPFEEIRSETGSGFRFEADFFAKLVAERDQVRFEALAQASIDNAATLDAILKSARSGQFEVIA